MVQRPHSTNSTRDATSGSLSKHETTSIGKRTIEIVGIQDLSMGTQRGGTKDPKEYTAICRRGEAERAILTERGGGRGGGETREEEAQTPSQEAAQACAV